MLHMFGKNSWHKSYFNFSIRNFPLFSSLLHLGLFQESFFRPTSAKPFRRAKASCALTALCRIALRQKRSRQNGGTKTVAPKRWKRSRQNRRVQWITGMITGYTCGVKFSSCVWRETKLKQTSNFSSFLLSSCKTFLCMLASTHTITRVFSILS